MVAFSSHSDSCHELRRYAFAGFGCSLILEVTEALSEAIEERGLTRSEVAKRLGKTKGFVSQLLAGGRNLTLRTVADIADAIGISLKVAVQSAEISKRATRPRRKDLSVETARGRLSRVT